MDRRFGRVGGGSLYNRQKCGIPCLAVFVAICWCLFIASKIPDSIFLGTIRKKNLLTSAISIKEATSVNNKAVTIRSTSSLNSSKGLKFVKK